MTTLKNIDTDSIITNLECEAIDTSIKFRKIYLVHHNGIITFSEALEALDEVERKFIKSYWNTLKSVKGSEEAKQEALRTLKTIEREKADKILHLAEDNYNKSMSE